MAYEPDIDGLPAKLVRGDPIDEEEREFLSELVKRFGHRELTPREVARLKSKVVAGVIHVQLVVWETLHRERNGLISKPQLEALIATAEVKFGLKRRRIFAILKEHRGDLEELRRCFREPSSAESVS